MKVHSKFLKNLQEDRMLQKCIACQQYASYFKTKIYFKDQKYIQWKSINNLFPKKYSVDIDDNYDFVIAETLFKKKKILDDYTITNRN